MKMIKTAALLLLVMTVMGMLLSVTAAAETQTASVDISADTHGKGDRVSGRLNYIFRRADINSRYNCYYYEDNYFSEKSTVYNPHLATVSLVAALSSFTVLGGDAQNCYYKADYLFNCFGFSGFETNAETDYPPTSETIGVIMAKKTVLDEGKPYTLVSVVIRGGGYYSEWANNFLVGGADENNGDHKGFSDSRDRALGFITDYIERNVEGDMKIWITGFSRGGAVAGLLGAWFNDNRAELPALGATLRHDDIFAYTFEAPGSVDKKNLVGKKYDNIFNFVSENDYVPRLPFSGHPEQGWNFERPGVRKSYPNIDKSNIKEFEQILKAIKPGASYEINNFTSLLPSLGNTQASFLDKFVSGAAERLDRQTYVNNVQEPLVEIMSNLMGMSSSEYDRAIGGFVSGLCADLGISSGVGLYWVTSFIDSLVDGGEEADAFVSSAVSNLVKAGIIDEYNKETEICIYTLVDCFFRGESDDVRLAYFFINIFLNTVSTEIGGYTVTQNRVLSAHYPELIMALGIYSDSYYKGEQLTGYDRYAPSSEENVVRIEIKSYGISRTAYYYKGDTVHLDASLTGCLESEGWYLGGRKLSDSPEYSFRADESVTLELRTKELHGDLTDWIVGQQPTDSSPGFRYRICNDCARHVDRENLPRTGAEPWDTGAVVLVSSSAALGIVLVSVLAIAVLRRRKPK